MDLSALLPALAGLGPWGIVIGIGVTLLGQFLRNRIAPANPLAPKPDPGPAPNPLAPLLPVGPSERPLRDVLLRLLPLVLARNHAAPVPTAPVADPVEDELLKLVAAAVAKKA